MDRRTILAIVLSLAIYYAWLAVRGPVRPPDAAPVESEPVTVTAPAPAAAPVATSAVPIRSVPFAACGAGGTVSTDGGRLHGVTLARYSSSFTVVPLYQWIVGRFTGSSDPTWLPYGTPSPATPLSDRAAALAAGVGDHSLVPMSFAVEPGAGPQSRVELVGTTQGGVEIRKTFAEHREGEGTCWIDVSVTWTNRGAEPFTGDLWLSVKDHPHVSGRYDQQQPMALADGTLRYGGASGAGWFGCSGTRLTDKLQEVPLDSPVTWFGQSDRYFGFFVVPEKIGGTSAFSRTGTGEDTLDGAIVTYAETLQPGASKTELYKAYVGPLVEKQLEAVHPDLSRAIDLGFWAFFGYPLIWLLRLFHGWFGNWGLAIVALTVVVKVAFFRLTQQSFVAAEKMKKIQPELNAVKEQFADNPQELQRRQLEVMQKHQVNPLSGCLPMLIQMPVWLALNQVLLTSVDLHHAQFLYLKDLTAADPYLILPVSITVMMWAQQQMSMSAGLDPAQQQVMRYMPLIFGLMFFAFPSGLAVYVFVNMVLTIVQQWIIKRTIGSEPVPTAAAAG